MKRRSFNNVMAIGCAVVLAAFLSFPLVTAQAGPAGDPAARSEGRAGQKLRISVQPAYVFASDTVVPGAGSLVARSQEGVYMSFHSTGLTAGTVVSAWWVFFNNPKRCGTSPCTAADLSVPEAEPALVYAAARIVGADGVVDYSAYRAVGDTTGVVTGSALLDPMKSEIHLVLRSHGPAMVDNPQVLQEQLSSFNGGCPPNTCGNLLASIHQP